MKRITLDNWTAEDPAAQRAPRYASLDADGAIAIRRAPGDDTDAITIPARDLARLVDAHTALRAAGALLRKAASLSPEGPIPAYHVPPGYTPEVQPDPLAPPASSSEEATPPA